MIVLNSKIRNELLLNLNSKWGINGDYWVPIETPSVEQEVVYFPEHYFLEDCGIEKLKEILKKVSDVEIYKWHWEIGNEELYKITIDELTSFNQEKLEVFYFDINFDWVIYISHENTIAFGGNLLVQQLKQDWANWNKHINEWII